MATTGGGLIVFGVADDGQPSGADVSNVAKLDPARITDKIASYTGLQFAGVAIGTYEHNGARYPAFEIAESKWHIVFTTPGTYPTPEEKQHRRTTFSTGTIYVRHGAKSEPANSDDVREFMQRRIDEVAEKWKQGIAQVVGVPLDHKVRVVPPGMKLVDDGDAGAIRLDDEAVPAAHFCGQTKPTRIGRRNLFRR